MKPLINTAAGVRALEEMVRTMPYYPPGVLLFESEEPKTMLVKGEVPLLYSWTSTGKRVGNPAESVIVGKAGFGIVPGAEIDGKIVNRPAITPGRGMAVSKYSKKKEATMKVLEFISLPEQSLKIVMDPKTIMDPWRLSHLRSEKFRKAFPDADKYLDAIEATFPFLVPDPVIPAADEDLPASIAILAPDQYYRGYTLVVSKTHATELYHLDERESTQYFRDMLRVAAAVAAAFRPRKMNYEVLGNTVAHLHWHLFPRYDEDPNPKRPTWERSHAPRLPGPDEYAETLAAIRRHLR